MNLRRSLLLLPVAFPLGFAFAWAFREQPTIGSVDPTATSPKRLHSALPVARPSQTNASLLRETDGFKSAAAWLLKLESASASDFPGLFLLTFDAPADLQNELTAAAASRWAEIDPESMLAYFLNDGRSRFPGNDYFIYTGNLFSSWAKSDPEAALAATGHFSNAGSYAWTVLMDAFRESPEAGIAMINAHPERLGELAYVPYFFGKEDHLSLLASFAGVENEELRTTLTGRVVAGFMKRDPEGAWRWWRAADPGLQRTVADSIAGSGADAGRFMTTDDLNRLRAIASETSDTVLAAKVVRFAVESGGFDEPVGETLAWVRSNVHGLGRQWALASVLGDAVGKDPEGALAAYGSLPQGTERMPAATAIAQALAKTDPQAALGWLQTQPSGEATTEGFRALAETWAKEDWTAASNYALSMPQHPAAREFDHALAYARFETNPLDAVQWSMNLSGERFERVAGELIHTWTRDRTADAMAFVQELPAGEQRNVMFTSMATAYYQDEGEQAAPWIATLRGNDRLLALAAVEAVGGNEDWKSRMRAAAESQP